MDKDEAYKKLMMQFDYASSDLSYLASCIRTIALAMQCKEMDVMDDCLVYPSDALYDISKRIHELSEGFFSVERGEVIGGLLDE